MATARRALLASWFGIGSICVSAGCDVDGRALSDAAQEPLPGAGMGGAGSSAGSMPELGMSAAGAGIGAAGSGAPGSGRAGGPGAGVAGAGGEQPTPPPDAGACADGACECLSGETNTCGTVHAALGACAERALTCGADGRWPSSESCAPASAEQCLPDGVDEDCDGLVNEGPPCDTFAKVAVGAISACGVTAAGRVYCWGRNTDGQLGSGVLEDELLPRLVSGLPNVLDVDAAGFRACALLGNGTVNCWGAAFTGDDTLEDRAAPVLVEGVSLARGIAVGNRLSCAILQNTSVMCWGVLDIDDPSVGDITTNTVSARAVVNLSNVAALSIGEIHQCALLGDGSVRCWGRASNGALGTGVLHDDPNDFTVEGTPTAVPGVANAVQVSCGNRFSCALLNDGRIQCWGLNDAGQLGDGGRVSRAVPGFVPRIANAIAIDAGVSRTCAVLADGRTQCWGKQGLGDGRAADSLVPVTVSGFERGRSVSGGQNHSCGVTERGDAYCWGNAVDGELGNGAASVRDAVAQRVLGP